LKGSAAIDSLTIDIKDYVTGFQTTPGRRAVFGYVPDRSAVRSEKAERPRDVLGDRLG
jgi:hypothetical protein